MSEQKNSPESLTDNSGEEKHIPKTRRQVNKSNINEVIQYLKYLSPRGVLEEEYTVWWADNNTGKPLKGGSVLHDSGEEILKQVKSYAGQANLHITINQTDGKGRKTGNIKAPRVLCLDIDRVIDDEELTAICHESSPSLCVESSPGKYHLYWRLDGSVSLEQWRIAQMGLAFKYSGDMELHIFAKTIRVPGVMRLTKEGEAYLPHIVAMGTGFQLGWSDLLELFPDLTTWAEEGFELRKKKNAELSKKFKKILSARSLSDKKKALEEMNGLGAGSRNVSLFSMVREFVAKAKEEVTQEMALEVALEINAGFSPPMDEDEVRGCTESAYRHGLERWERNQEAILEARRKLEVPVTPQSESNEPSVPTSPTVAVSLDEELKEELPSIPKQEGGTGLGGEGKEGAVEGVRPEVKPDFDYDYSDTFLKINRFTDQALVSRVLQRFGNKIVNVDDRLYAFDEVLKCWKQQHQDRNSQIVGFVRKCTLDLIKDEDFVAELCTNGDGEFSVDKQKKAEASFLSSSRQRGVAGMVSCSDQIRRVERRAFDAHPHKLLCGNGVVNLLTGELTTPRAEDYLLGNSTVKYDRDAKCPRFKQFVVDVFAYNEDNKAMYRFMQELFGYCLTPSIKEERIFCHLGEGANGKSKMLQALYRLMDGYSTIIDPDEMASGKRANLNKTFEKFASKIEGCRVAIVDDIDVNTVWNESFVKNVTGPVLRARAEYQVSRQIQNRCKVHMGLNVAPSPQAENYGILRRLCIIPYSRTFEPNADTNAAIERMIEEELSGILNWAIEGFRRMHEQGGIMYPDELKSILEEYRSEHFSVSTLIEEMYGSVLDGRKATVELSVEDVMQELSALGGVTGGESFNKVTVGRALGKISTPVRKLVSGRKVRYYRLVRLKPAPDAMDSL